MTSLAQYIDHTALAADTTEQKIQHLCQEAKTYGFWSVCINPAYIPFAKKLLADSDVKICTVIGFPLGANMTQVKSYETEQAILAGAQEIDMVVNVGWVKSELWDKVRSDIQAVFDACRGVPLKVILETCLLTEQEICQLCQICLEIGVAFVKTSTGFSSGGATVEAVELMKQVVGESVKIKASGGVRCRATAQQMLEAGASRLGTSSGVAIVTDKESTNAQY
ncbi:deoxyribose-phosphate aldolase [Rodentibacter caecimuris]|uniref:Deoxyribose-phosphate aldolase n=1 Tax=Rodentibacter caecimuris TaxID=1796644 RepID=A0ABX3L1C8_9PAST|nr:deoxyribose-phosphate aldolase [Rodentibacter heylii]